MLTQVLPYDVLIALLMFVHPEGIASLGLASLVLRRLIKDHWELFSASAASYLLSDPFVAMSRMRGLLHLLANTNTYDRDLKRRPCGSSNLRIDVQTYICVCLCRFYSHLTSRSASRRRRYEIEDICDTTTEYRYENIILRGVRCFVRLNMIAYTKVVVLNTLVIERDPSSNNSIDVYIIPRIVTLNRLCIAGLVALQFSVDGSFHLVLRSMSSHLVDLYKYCVDSITILDLGVHVGLRNHEGSGMSHIRQYSVRHGRFIVVHRRRGQYRIDQDGVTTSQIQEGNSLDSVRLRLLSFFLYMRAHGRRERTCGLFGCSWAPRADTRAMP